MQTQFNSVSTLIKIKISKLKSTQDEIMSSQRSRFMFKWYISLTPSNNYLALIKREPIQWIEKKDPDEKQPNLNAAGS